RIGQRHPATPLIDSSQRDVRAGDVENGISRYERRGVTVWTEAEMREIEYDRRSRDLAEGQGITFAGRLQIRRFHRHRMNVLGDERTVREQTLAEVSEVAIGIALRRDAHVDLQHMSIG